MEKPALESPISDGTWKFIQFAIFLGFVFANIYLEWGIDGLAAGVMGGMLSWYSTGIANHYLSRWYSRRNLESSL